MSTATRNPVAIRLHKVLSTSFSDAATQQALATLSELYALPALPRDHSSTTPIAKDRDEEEDDFEDTLPSVSVSALDGPTEHAPGEIVANARKNLQRDIEGKLATSSKQFLQALGDVDKRLSDLQEHINSMRGQCDEAETRLLVSTAASQPLLERASSLRRSQAEVQSRASILNLFLSRFTLSEDETDALTSRDVPVGTRFFTAMDRTEQVRNECSILMTGEEGPTQAGLDIMSTTSAALEEGYSKLLRWCTFEFRQRTNRNNTHEHLDITPTMRTAVRRLRQRPELLTEALAVLSKSRSATILASFLQALTRGHPSGLPRPIELHAHDPMRYIGDMLAWVHQSVAAEKEGLDALFGLDDRHTRRMVGQVRNFDYDVGEDEDWVAELLDKSIEKLCVPLKIRVQQTTRSQESSIMSYKIVNLLQFYTLTFHRTIGPKSVLSTTIQEMNDLAYQVFLETIEARGRALLRVSLDIDDASLTPPVQILDHCQIIREVVSVFESSLFDDASSPTSATFQIKPDDAFQHVLDIMVDPSIEMCLASAEEKQRMKPHWDKNVFILNCLSYLQSTLESFKCASHKIEQVQKDVDNRVAILSRDHYDVVLKDAGLAELVSACDSHGDEPLSRLPAAQPAQLLAALRKFSAWLSSPAVENSTRLSQLTDQRQRLSTKIHQATLEKVGQAYEIVCVEVRKPENKFEAASTLLGSENPFGNIRSLRQILGLDD